MMWCSTTASCAGEANSTNASNCLDAKFCVCRSCSGIGGAAVEDVEYIQKKLFAALKIPRAYLGYDEDIGAKATLAQEDIRFSRSIQRIQKTVLSELNKVAMIHLFSHGYEGEDLMDFELKLSNPSSVAQQQKLELIARKFEIAGTAPEGVVDRQWIRKNVLSL